MTRNNPRASPRYESTCCHCDWVIVGSAAARIERREANNCGSASKGRANGSRCCEKKEEVAEDEDDEDKGDEDEDDENDEEDKVKVQEDKEGNEDRGRARRARRTRRRTRRRRTRQIGSQAMSQADRTALQPLVRTLVPAGDPSRPARPRDHPPRDAVRGGRDLDQAAPKRRSALVLPYMHAISLVACHLAGLRGTKEMSNPCLVCIHAISLVARHMPSRRLL